MTGGCVSGRPVFRLGFLLSFVLVTLTGAAQQGESVARFVVWQPKPGMSRDLEEGYKRHLEWHRQNADPWTWLGWTIISGERFGWFVDATAGHTWADLDTPIAPAADSADNAVNVFPYGDIRMVATYEVVAGPASLDAKDLESPLLTFTYLEVQPGAAMELEARLLKAFRTSEPADKCSLLRPTNGADEYLLLIPATKTSDLSRVSRLVERLLTATRQSGDASPIVLRYRTETGRYRADLSYAPAER